MRTNEPVTIRREDYQPYPWHVVHTKLMFELEQASTKVTATLTIERVVVDSDEPLVLDGVNLQLEALSVDGEALVHDRYELCDQKLMIKQLPSACELTTVARIDPDSNTALEGLYRSGGTFCTQCEAEGFRKITWYPDRPDVLSVFEVDIIAPADLASVLLSNGNLISEGVLEDGRRCVRWSDPFPKPAYLFALVAGDLVQVADTYITASGRRVNLDIYVEAHNAKRCDFAMASLKRAMAWDERAYGLEYDLDRYMIVAVDDFNMGAMENKGLNIFNSKFVLADPETATDVDFLWVEAVIAHEYFHNWTGNRITCRDWFQLSLKEGLTVYRDQSFTADHHSPTVKRIDDVRRLRQTQFVEDAGPLAHPIRPDTYIEINNFYTTTIYEKGAEVIRMLHALIGDEAWHRGMELYVKRHDGSAATCEDFVQAMEAASGRSLEQFRLWYSLAGTPRLRCEEHWDADAASLSLVLSQQCPDTPGQSNKPPMHIPVSIGFLNAAGEELVPEASTGLLELTEREQTFTFGGFVQRPIVSLLREFSAPVRVEREIDDQSLGVIACHDSDGFARWDAQQALMHRAVGYLVSDQSDRGMAVAEHVAGVIGAALESRHSDARLNAELLTLPSLVLLMEECAGVPVQVVHAAQQRVSTFVAKAHRKALENCVSAGIQWSRSQPADPSGDAFGFGGAGTATRALAAAALNLLASDQEADWIELASSWYRTASTMTDRVSALSVLCHAKASERDECLADFERRFRDNALVMDKWFALQALSDRDDTLAQAKALSQRDDFDVGNPNRLRSLVGSFSTGNPRRFHAVGGVGHAWLADWVMQVDAINPLTAARLVVPLTRWQGRDVTCQESMRTQLSRILDTESLSADVYEQVSKSL